MTESINTTTKKSGRPKKYEDSAARQKAYRVRLKAAGFREIKKIVRDVRDRDKPLVSDIIDLSKFMPR